VLWDEYNMDVLRAEYNWYTNLYVIGGSPNEWERDNQVRYYITQDIICWILGHVCPEKCEEHVSDNKKSVTHWLQTHHKLKNNWVHFLKLFYCIILDL